MLPRTTVTRKKKKHPLLILLIIIGITGCSWALLHNPAKNHSPASSSQETTSKAQKNSFDTSKYSLTDPSSIWVVANKLRPLTPARYAPSDLTAPNMPLKSSKTSTDMQVHAEMAAALGTMATAANAQGIKLVLASGYRSYDYQVTVYNSEVKAYGKAKADQESARPGFSEHQTGWAADLGATSGKCTIQACFADTAEGKWLAANAYRYGFIIRYVKDKTAVTGYTYEPWHVRYVGTDLSKELHRTGAETLEEFFKLPAAPSY